MAVGDAFLRRRRADDDAPWLVDLLVGLDRQLTHIERNLSHYFSPNTHLLGEALALYVSGRALPELAASDASRDDRPCAFCWRKSRRQIAADGGHCERSTHYHRYTLDFYLLALIVARITGDPTAASRFEDGGRRGWRGAARLLADDRGRVPHIGDDDGGTLLPIAGRAPDDCATASAVAPRSSIAGPARSARRAGRSAVAARASTLSEPIARASRRDAARRGDVRGAARHRLLRLAVRRAAITSSIDGGPHGYQNGGHAHADALSLTLYGRGRAAADRSRAPAATPPTPRCAIGMRSSALHNTLVVDGRSQSIPSGPFHWSHVANGSVRRWRTNDGVRLLRRLARRLPRRSSIGATCSRCTAISWSSPTWSRHRRAHGRGALAPRSAVDRRRRCVDGAVFDARRRTRRAGRCPPGVSNASTATRHRARAGTRPSTAASSRRRRCASTHSGAAPFWMVSVFGLDASNAGRRRRLVPVWAEAGALAHARRRSASRAPTSVDHVLFVRRAAPTGADEPRATWRVGEVETDARMLFCPHEDRPDASALVDGSLVGRRRPAPAARAAATGSHADPLAERIAAHVSCVERPNVARQPIGRRERCL